ncbi:hypothetical protein MMC12_000003 [Toensbergia leucococca]|nr:hypothetical protein [Toensbergia leucococca]
MPAFSKIPTYLTSDLGRLNSFVKVHSSSLDTTPYSFDLARFADVQHLDAPTRSLCPPIDISFATMSLEGINHPDQPLDEKRASALRRLATLEDLDLFGTWGPDIIYRVFQDLDDALFRGSMSGNVALNWIDETHPELNGGPGFSLAHVNNGKLSRPWAVTNTPLSYTPKERVRYRATVQLNRQALYEGRGIRLKQVVETLIHEMIHAYLWVMTGDGRDHDDSECVSHGAHFRRCLVAINDPLRKHTYLQGTIAGDTYL